MLHVYSIEPRFLIKVYHSKLRRSHEETTQELTWVQFSSLFTQKCKTEKQCQFMI